MLSYRVPDVAMNVVVPSAGPSWQWAEEVDGHMTDAGLVKSTARSTVSPRPGDPEAKFYSNYTQQPHTPLLNAGITSGALRHW